MQRCHRASCKYSAALSIRPRQASEMMSRTPLRSRSTRCRRNADQPDLSSLAPSQMPRISLKSFRVDRAGHQERDIANLAGPAALHHDAVEIKIRMLTFDPPVPPGLDLGVDLLVEVRDRAWAYPRAPEGLGDVLHPPNRNPRQIHLDQRFLD